MKPEYDPRETRKCEACTGLGHVGGMLLQPGGVWVHRRCTTGWNSFGVEEARILVEVKAWRGKLTHGRHEHRSDRRLERKIP